MLVSKDCHPGFQKQPASFAITWILPWFPQELSYHFSQNNLCTLLPLPSKPERLTFSHEALKWGKRLHVTQPMRSTIGPCGHSFPEDYDLTQGKVTSGDEVGMLTEGREVPSMPCSRTSIVITMNSPQRKYTPYNCRCPCFCPLLIPKSKEREPSWYFTHVVKS